MWKTFWRKWTLDRPAVLGDWLWDVLVVQLAGFLDRLTFRQVIALLPVVILVLAYYHRIPIPPELMLVGDLLAYIDVFSLVFLLGMLSRAASVLFAIRQAASRAKALATAPVTVMRRLDRRHRRARRNSSAKRAGRRSEDAENLFGARGIAFS